MNITNAKHTVPEIGDSPEIIGLGKKVPAVFYDETPESRFREQPCEELQADSRTRHEERHKRLAQATRVQMCVQE